MMVTSYVFQFNGWTLAMKLNIEPQKILNDLIEVKISILGCDFNDRHAFINLKTREMVCEDGFTYKPYTHGKSYKITRKFIIPFDTIMRIKAYLQ